jgi:hypothetical protein
LIVVDGPGVTEGFAPVGGGIRAGVVEGVWAGGLGSAFGGASGAAASARALREVAKPTVRTALFMG